MLLDSRLQNKSFSTEWQQTLPELHLLPRHRSLLRHYATSQTVAGSIRDVIGFFFNLPKPSSRIMALGSTQPLTEMSTRNLPGDKEGPVRKADNLAAICEPTT
jgi:hypothetical protein